MKVQLYLQSEVLSPIEGFTSDQRYYFQLEVLTPIRSITSNQRYYLQLGEVPPGIVFVPYWMITILNYIRNNKTHDFLKAHLQYVGQFYLVMVSNPYLRNCTISRSCQYLILQSRYDKLGFIEYYQKFLYQIIWT